MMYATLSATDIVISISDLIDLHVFVIFTA